MTARSLGDSEVERVITKARLGASGGGGRGLTPSPADWRDVWIYFLMVDRFNCTFRPPHHQPWNDPEFVGYQGGTFEGVQAALPYIKELGAGAIWLSPVLKNLPFDEFSYHGYGIHDFLHAEPRFARDPARADDELRELIDDAHALGLYVILDIVLNHVGDVFAYACRDEDSLCAMTDGAQASFSPSPMTVKWRDSFGRPGSINDVELAAPSDRSYDAMVWPVQLQLNRFFRRQGVPDPGGLDTVGDFESLKQMRTDDPDLQRTLIAIYSYAIARWDVDGFRIDTLRYLQGGLPRLFGNAIREFAESVGKKNFFTFGEVFDPQAEEDIAQFIGRHTNDRGQMVGVDAALDYPLYFILPGIAKGFSPPTALNAAYWRRMTYEQSVISSHGDATRFFVTFLDNHDVKQRIRYVEADGSSPYDDQVTLALTCLMTLPGIPCIYYGTEQGLHGAGSDAAVREALWGGPGFAPDGPFCSAIAALSELRREVAPLRYGRVYLRPLSGDGENFGLSTFAPGVLAYSRILADQEVLVVANTTQSMQRLDVIVDQAINTPATSFGVRFSNKSNPSAPDPLRMIVQASVAEVDGSFGSGPLMVCGVTLQPREVQVLCQRNP